MFLKLKIKPMLALLLCPLAFLAAGCEEQEAVDRDLTLSELQIISKQWCATVQVPYGAPYFITANTLVKLDLTATGYVHVNTVSASPMISPAYRQSNSLSCNRTERENIMDCYGIGPIQFSLDTSEVLTTNLIAETDTFTECTSQESAQFR